MTFRVGDRVQYTKTPIPHKAWNSSYAGMLGTVMDAHIYGNSIAIRWDEDPHGRTKGPWPRHYIFNLSLIDPIIEYNPNQQADCDEDI